MPQRVLLTGATGFIGRNLHGLLLEAGLEVRCLTRKPEEAYRLWPDRCWVGGDLGAPESLAAALEDCDIAYYLVHGMGSHRPGWAEEELRWAGNFARAAELAGVGRIIYLGGVAPQGPPSEHLLSRLNTGAVLRAGAVPTLELRAGMIIGAGSASWTIVRDLAARLPAMVLPAWLSHKSEPVALADVLAALQAGAHLELTESTWWDIPGPEALSGREILLRLAAVMGRRPVLLKIPFITPRLSSHWIRLVTRADYAVARELVEGLTSDLIASRPGYWDAAGLPPPIGLEEAAIRALAAEAGTISRAGRFAENMAGWLTPRSQAGSGQARR
ncbi:MAG: NAD(P)H-binding protein [Geothrix sp.]|uniref:NAD(P)H-binding protein n=1 Tax=Geothrix sp. TaxID=1962974 RepID=UPI003BAF7E77